MFGQQATPTGPPAPVTMISPCVGVCPATNAILTIVPASNVCLTAFGGVNEGEVGLDSHADPAASIAAATTSMDNCFMLVAPRLRLVSWDRPDHRTARAPNSQA